MLGAGGMLGRALLRTAPSDFEVSGRSRRETDVTAPAQVEAAVRSVGPDVIVNAAAYTAVDRAESEPGKARLVNAEAPGIIGEAALGALVVHYSTDYVFDGRDRRAYREDDPVSPLGVYGRTKLEGEVMLQRSGARHLIIRTSWLFGPGGTSFPRTMWQRARAAERTRVVSDQIGRPTYTVDLAETTWTLLNTRGLPAARAADGLLHAANAGTATWYDVARRVFAAVDRKKKSFLRKS